MLTRDQGDRNNYFACLLNAFPIMSLNYIYLKYFNIFTKTLTCKNNYYFLLKHNNNFIFLKIKN